MKKFGQILALVFMLAFGYGLGQHTQDLFATDYPGGGAGGGTHPVNLASDVTGTLPHSSTRDDAANVHGLGASVNVMGNRIASGEMLQHGIPNESATFGADKSFGAIGTTNQSFPVAFSATPTLVASVHDTTGDTYGSAVGNISTTSFSLRIIGSAGVGAVDKKFDYIAID
ncbi:hypothetical protein LCGC14_3143920 [marine sediment metagenome]|uniref:Uncharacterized protein n=1 Tax=marine sediment metagenome TaxID=412755 RepID=A0A0F8VW68_9ZZZZ